MFRTRAKHSYFVIQKRIFALCVLLTINQYCGSLTGCGVLAAGNNDLQPDNTGATTAVSTHTVDISYVKPISGLDKAVKLLEVGGHGLRSIKAWRSTNHADNCSTDNGNLHILESSDHFILASLRNKVHRDTANYLCYELLDGTWKHAGHVGKFSG